MPNHQGHNSKKKKHRRKGNDTAAELDNINGSISDLSLAEGKPYRIDISPVMGRYLVANKNLKAGELLMQVEPLVVGPCAESPPTCLGCNIEVKFGSKQKKCSICGWPLCSEKCRGIRRVHGHSNFECTSLREHRVADYFADASEKEISYMYESLLVLRCLLLQSSNQIAWKKLIEMEAHNEIRKAIPHLWARNQAVIVSRIVTKWKFPFSENLVHTVCGILEVNSFEVGSGGIRARALYPEAFYISHDCCPNTTHTDDPRSYALSIRLTQELQEGEMISLSYSYTLMGTLKRREHLSDSKFFMCNCKRCFDPTELSTYASALVCPKCVGGYILSTNPLDQNADWQCRKCGNKISGKHVHALVTRLFEEMETIDPNEVEGYESFLAKYRNVLHKNHYLNLSAKHNLCQVYGRSENHMLHQMSDAELKHKEDYCRDLLEVVDILEPGLSRLRGVIMYELHAPIMLQTNRLFEMNRISGQELKQRLREVIKLLRESEKILSFEPNNTPEAEMGAAAKDALIRMTSSHLKV